MPAEIEWGIIVTVRVDHLLGEINPWTLIVWSIEGDVMISCLYQP